MDKKQDENKSFFAQGVEKFHGLTKIIQGMVIIVLAVTGIVTTSMSAYNKSLDKRFELYNSMITAQISEDNQRLIEPLSQRLEAVEVDIYTLKGFQVAQIEKNIIKQYEKITNSDFGDIKKADLEDALNNYHLIVNPTPKISLAYTMIVEYYNDLYTKASILDNTPEPK